jgi:hypothetical protein
MFHHDNDITFRDLNKNGRLDPYAPFTGRCSRSPAIDRRAAPPDAPCAGNAPGTFGIAPANGGV